MNKFKKFLIPVFAIGILLASIVGGGCAIDSPPATNPSLGEIFDPSGNPFGHRFSDMKDIRTATFVVAASDSEHKYDVDWRCDGVDDQVQIQVALNDLPATGGKILLLDGTYTISAAVTIPNNTIISGLDESFASGGVTEIAVVGGFNANVFERAAATATGIHIANLYINMTGAAGGDAIHLDPSGYCSIHRCKIVGCTNAIHIGGGDTLIIDDVKTFGGIGVHGINSYTYIRNSEFIGSQYGIYNNENGPTLLLISGCSFENQTDSGIYLRQGSLASGDFAITNCTFNKAEYGIKLRYMSRGTITNNVFGGGAAGGYALGKHGIYAEEDSHYLTITGNTITNVSDTTDNTYDGISGAFGSCIIADNVIDAGATAKMRYGIYLNNTTPLYFNIIQGNQISNAKTAGIYVYDNNYTSVIGNIIRASGGKAAMIYPCANIIFSQNQIYDNEQTGEQADGTVFIFNSTRILVHNNIIRVGTGNMKWGVNIDGGSDVSVVDNYIEGARLADINDNGSDSKIYDQHSDTYEDVLASSANLIVNAQNFVNGAIALTGVDPNYPRGLVFAITAGVTGYTLTVVGTNGKGQTITEVFTFAVDGLAFSSDNAFDHVTSITLADRAGAAATIDVGIDGRLGLMNVIYETGDVWKITKNLAKQVVAGAQVDVNYDTYDMAAAIGIAVNDDFIIWYRSNLNIIS